MSSDGGTALLNLRDFSFTCLSSGGTALRGDSAVLAVKDEESSSQIKLMLVTFSQEIAGMSLE